MPVNRITTLRTDLDPRKSPSLKGPAPHCVDASPFSAIARGRP